MAILEVCGMNPRLLAMLKEYGCRADLPFFLLRSLRLCGFAPWRVIQSRASLNAKTPSREDVKKTDGY